MNSSEATSGASSKIPQRCRLSIKAHNGACHVARCDAKGRYVLSAGADRSIKLWSLGSLASSPVEAIADPIKTYSSGHSHEIFALDVTEDNAKFASGGGDKNVLVWDVASSTILRRFSAHEGRINVVSFAGGDGNSILCTAGFDAVLRFYDLRAQGAWRPILESKEAKDAITAFSCAGDQIWTGSVDGVMRCYDLRKGQLREDMIDEPIISLCASKSGSLVLASTTDSTHRLFDAADGSLLQSFTGHTNANYRCRSVLSPQEDLIYSGDESGHLHCWDVLTGEEQLALKSVSGRHQKAVFWTQCNPTAAGEVLTAGADGMIKIWS